MVVNTLLGEIPVLGNVPCDEMFPTTPGSQVLSCPGEDSVSGNYGIVSHMKFVAVYNENTESWDFVLSTSRILAEYELRAKVLVDNWDWRFVIIQKGENEEIAGIR